MTHYQAFPVLTAPLIDRKSIDPTPSSVGDTDDRQLLLKSEQPATVTVRVSGRPRPRVTWSVGSTTLATDDFGTAVLPSGVESPDSYVSLPTYRYALNVERVTDDWERRGGLTIQASNDLGTDTLTLPIKTYKVLCGKSSSPYRRESGGRHVRRLGSHTTVDSASAGGNGSVRSGTKSPSPAPSKRKDLSKYSWTVEDWTSWHKEMEARSRMRSIDDILDSDHEDDDEPSGQSTNSQRRQQPPQTTAFPYNPVVRANCLQTDIDSLTDVTNSTARSTIGKLATTSETELTSTTTSSPEVSSTSLVPSSDNRSLQRQQVTSTLTSSVGQQHETLPRTLPPPAPPRTISRLSTASNSASESEDCRKPVPDNIPANKLTVPSALDRKGHEPQQSTEKAPNWSKVDQDHRSQSVRQQEDEADNSSWQLFGSRLSEVCRQLLTDDIKDSKGHQTNVSSSILKENRQQVVNDDEATSEARDQKKKVGENTLCPVTPDSTAFRQQRPPSPASDLVISGPIPVVTYTLSSADLMYTSASSSFPRDVNRSPLIAPKTKPIVPAKPSVKSPRPLPSSAPSTPGTAEFVAKVPPLDTATRREVNDRPVCSNKPVVPPKPPVGKKPSFSGRGSCNPSPPKNATPRIASVDFRPEDLPPVSVRIIRKNDIGDDTTQTKRKSETDFERKPDVANRTTTTIVTEASQKFRSGEIEVMEKTAIPAFDEPATVQRPPKTCISSYATDHPLQRRQSEATTMTKFPGNSALKTSKSNEDLLNGICGQRHFSLSKSSSGSIAPACNITKSGREKAVDQMAFVGKEFILSDAGTVSRSPASSVSGTVGRRRTLSREWEVTWTTTQEEIITVAPNPVDDVSISSGVVADSSSLLNTSLTTQTASTQSSGYRTAVNDNWLINAQVGGDTFASSSSLPTQPDGCSNNYVSLLDNGNDRLTSAGSDMNRSWSMRNESLMLLSQSSAGKPGSGSGRIKVQFPVGSETEEVPTGTRTEAKTSSRVLDDLIDALTEIALAASTQEAEQQRQQIQQQMQTVSTWSR